MNKRSQEQLEQMPTSLTLSSLLLRQLKLWGVERIYGVAGDAILHLLQTIGEERHLIWVNARFESAAAMMASAESILSNRPGVCLGTSGPGLANMLNGLAVASADHIPLLVITGQVPQDSIGTEAKQYVEQQELIAPLACYSAEVQDSKALLPLLRTAYVTAMTKRGVAHLSIPQNLFSQIVTAVPRPLIDLQSQLQTENCTQLEQVVDQLQRSQRPALLLGVGARQAQKEIMQLAEIQEVALFESLGAKGVISFHHPFFLGGLGEGGTMEGMALFQQADFILVIGSNWWPDGFVPQQATVASIDLAVASIETHPAANLGLIGDATTVLTKIINQLQQRSRVEWKKQITQCKEQIDQAYSHENSPPDALTPAQVMSILSDMVDDDGIITVDTGDHTIWFNQRFRATNQEVLFSGKWRTMGYGLPAAIGAQLAAPQKQVTTIVGDGSFVTTMMELSALHEQQLPITILILKNHTYGKEESSMLARGYQPYGVQLANPNFVQLAQAYGIAGEQAKDADQLLNALKKAYKSKAPFVVEIETAYITPPFTQ